MSNAKIGRNGPVRKTSNRGGNVIGYFPSIKMGRMVPFESTIERDLLYILDYASEVVDYEAQPLVIPYEHEGKEHTYTPDFLVGMADRDLLIECKPASLCDNAENKHKWAAAREWCADCHWQFVVVTDRQLRDGYLLENVKLLTQFARHSVMPQVKSRVFALLMAAASRSTNVTVWTSTDAFRQEATPPAGLALPDILYPVSISQLARLIAPEDPNSAISSILHLTFHHKLDAPLCQAPLSGDTPLWLPAYPPHDIPEGVLLPHLAQLPTLP